MKTLKYLGWFLLSGVIAVHSQTIIQPEKTCDSCFDKMELTTFSKAIEDLTGSAKPSEEVLLSNTFHTYNMFRQTAVLSMRLLNTGLNIANAIMEQINSLDAFFEKIVDINKNVSNVSSEVERIVGGDWKNPIGIMDTLEKNVFQKTDTMTLGSLVGIKPAYRDSADTTVKGVRDSSVKLWGAVRYEGRMLDTTARTIPWYSWVASDIKAKESNARRDSIESIQRKMMSGNKINMFLLAKGSKYNRRMEYLQSLREHEQIGENIALWSGLLMRENEALSATNMQRRKLFDSMREGE